MADDETIDDGGELDPGEAASHFMERTANADAPPGDHSTLTADAAADFMRRYNEQAG